MRLVALSLAEAFEEAPAFCGWPECPVPSSNHGFSRGFCRKHLLRLQRGRELGCESAWEQLVVAALAIAAADTDADFDRAAARLDRAAMAYNRRGATLRARRRRTS